LKLQQQDLNNMRPSRVRVFPLCFTAVTTLLFACPGVFAQVVTVGTWTADSTQANASFGSAVASAGDVNNDGYDDVIVGSPGYANGQTNEGRALVYLGGPTGPAATPVWDKESNQIGGLYGQSVAGAGDVNGDGYDDVIVGAPGIPPPVGYAYGWAYLYLGNSTGVDASPVMEQESLLSRDHWRRCGVWWLRR